MTDTVSIFLATPIVLYQPYNNWKIKTPSWWDAYNKIKHDRLNNYKYSTYENTVSSLVALHQIMARSRLFTNNSIKAGMFNPKGKFMVDLHIAKIMELNALPVGKVIPLESKYIVSPVEDQFVYKQKNKFYNFIECDFSDRIKNILAMSALPLKISHRNVQE